MKYQIVLTSANFFTNESKALFATVGANLVLNSECKTEHDLIEAVRDADVVLTTSAPFTKDVLAELPNLKGVVRIGVGIDNFDLQAASEKGIIVCTVPTFYVEDVANQTLAFIDGDHSEEGSKYDWDKFEPLVVTNGLIALHDSIDFSGRYKPAKGHDGPKKLRKELEKLQEK